MWGVSASTQCPQWARPLLCQLHMLIVLGLGQAHSQMLKGLRYGGASREEKINILLFCFYRNSKCSHGSVQVGSCVLGNHLCQQPGTGSPSGPTGHGWSRPGGPGSPFWPFIPFRPGTPRSPFSPRSLRSPFSPRGPGKPSSPGSPGLPFSPLVPGSPIRPGGPAGPWAEKEWVRGLTVTEIKASKDKQGS